MLFAYRILVRRIRYYVPLLIPTTFPLFQTPFKARNLRRTLRRPIRIIVSGVLYGFRQYNIRSIHRYIKFSYNCGDEQIGVQEGCGFIGGHHTENLSAKSQSQIFNSRRRTETIGFGTDAGKVYAARSSGNTRCHSPPQGPGCKLFIRIMIRNNCKWNGRFWSKVKYS